MTRKELLIALCVGAAACTPDRESVGPDGRLPTDTVRAFTVQERDVAKASTAFGLNLLRDVHQDSSHGNLLLSPLSISLALGMTLNGADGTTFSAIRNTLGFTQNLEQAAINAAYHGLIRQLRARDSKVEFGLANSIWYDQTFPVYPTFVDTVRHYFDAEVRALNFRDAAAPATINQWTDQNTGGRIKELLKSISPDEVMFLVNAVYFKAPWTRPFDPNATRAAAFRRPDGSTVNAQMMFADGSFNYVTNDRVHAVELLYADSAYSMVLMMPTAGTSLDAITSALEPSQWEGVLSTMHPSRIILRMPKFRFEYEKELKEPLNDLGMGIAFRPFDANFTRIADRNDIFISRVQHKSFIDVHELGTEAAAATAVGFGVTSMPPELVFDRPFFFAIRERSTGTLLFVGRVTDPTRG